VQNCESGGYPITEAIMTINFPDRNIEIMSNTSAVKTHETEKTVSLQSSKQTINLSTELLNSQTDDRSTPTLLNDNSSPKILNPSNSLEYDMSTTHSTQNENTVRKGVSHVSRTQGRSEKRSQSSNPYNRSMSRNRNGFSPASKNRSTGKSIADPLTPKAHQGNN
jgi:hypothetical protein